MDQKPYSCEKGGFVMPMICDVCQKDTKGRSDNFQIDYEFGYGSEHDGDRVQAAICDDCLADLIKSHVPAATWIKFKW